MAKLDEALKPSVAMPIKARQMPKKIFRRLARSAKKPDGKLATPAEKVRAEANAPACARLRPKAEVMMGRITTTTALNRCSVICAAQLAASRPQLASGELNVVAVSTFTQAHPVKKLPRSHGFHYNKPVYRATYKANGISHLKNCRARVTPGAHLTGHPIAISFVLEAWPRTMWIFDFAIPK